MPSQYRANPRASWRRQIRPAAGLGEDRVRDGERIELEALKGDLLRQHNIAYGQTPVWCKAQEAGAFAIGRQFFNVHLISLMDAVALARGAADHIKKAMPVELGALRGRKILLEQLEGALLDRAIARKQAAGIEQTIPPSPDTRQALWGNRRRRERAAQKLMSSAHRHGPR